MIIINGPACSGKTVVSKTLWERLKKTALINLDDIKWLISDCKTDDFHLDLAREIGASMAEQYLKNKVNVIIEKAFCHIKFVQPFITISKKYDAKHYLFNIEAPLDVIIQRCKQRPPNHRSHKITALYAGEIHESYQENLFPVNKTFDSSKISINEIVREILQQVEERPENGWFEKSA